MQIDIIKDFLNRQNWQFTQLKDSNLILFGISGDNGNFQCIANIIEEEKQFSFTSVCGANTLADKKILMLELLNVLNGKLFLGNFEMDFVDGEIRLRTNISYKYLDLNTNSVEELIMTNIITMDRSLPSIMGLMYGNISVAEAVENYNKENRTRVAR